MMPVRLVFDRKTYHSPVNINPGDFRQIPVRKASELQQSEIVSMVNQILSRKKRNVDADTSALEREIDQKVYVLYGLTPEERKTVEDANV
jgi:adenine-specific DNA-methyltransferase